MNQTPRGLASSRARQAWLRACRDAGQPEVKFYEGTKHTFASAALDRTENERAVQEYMGHSDLAPRSATRSSRTSDSSTW